MMKLNIQLFAEGKIIIGTELDTKSFNAQINQLEDKLDTLVQEYSAALKDEEFPEDELKKYQSEIEKTKNKIISLKQKQDDLEKFNLKEIPNIMGDIGKSVDGIGNSMQKITKKAVNWGLAVFGIQRAFSFIRSSMSTLSQYDEKLASDVDYIRNSLAFAIEPVIRVIVELMKQLLVLIGGVIKLVTGRNIFAETNKGLKNANKGAKDLKKQLAGFDEMNVLSDTSSGGGTMGVEFDPSSIDNMSVEIDKIIGKWKQFGDEMKKAIDLPLSDWFDGFGEWGLAMEGVTQYVYGLWEVVDGFFGFLKGGFDIIVGLITGNEKLVKKGIVELLDSLWEIIDGFLNMIVGNIRIVLGVILGIVVNIAKIIWENIVSAFKLGLSIISGIFTTLIEILKAPFRIMWETVQSVFNGVKNVITGIFNLFKSVFTGDIKGVLNSFKQIFKGVMDSLWGIVKAPLNLIIEGINALIKGINKIKFDVPDWVPVIGGQKWGFKISKIPKLEKGGIVNNPGPGVMMGSYIAGERGPEAVIPLDDDTLNRLGLAFARHTQINATVPVYVGNRQIAREIRKINAEDDFAFNS